LKDAEAQHMPVTLFAAKSSGCRNYQTLAEEILKTAKSENAAVL